MSLTGAGILNTATVTPAAAGAVYGTASTSLSATVVFVNGLAPSGAFTFQVDTGATVSASCTGASSPLTCAASYNTSTLTAGPHTITGLLAADSNYSTASGTSALTVSTATPMIALTVPNHVYGDPVFTVGATSNSTGAFTYSLISGPAVITGNAVTLTGYGTVILQASEAADPNYTAGSRQATFAVSQAALTITANNTTRYYGAPNPSFTGADRCKG